MTGEIVARVVRALEGYYRVAAEDPRPFVSVHDDESSREMLLVRQGDDEVEMTLVLPKRLATARWETLSLDERCQVVEGASHFLMVCDRARGDRSTTQLELELQAEVDKWVVLSNGGRLHAAADLELRDALYDADFPGSAEGGTGVCKYLHAGNTPQGERYRVANNLAARFVHRLSTGYARTGRHHEMRAELSKFFRMTQEQKLRTVAA